MNIEYIARGSASCFPRPGPNHLQILTSKRQDFKRVLDLNFKQKED